MHVTKWYLCINPQALSNQQKAVLMSERVLGIEHPNTIQEYVSFHSICMKYLAHANDMARQ